MSSTVGRNSLIMASGTAASRVTGQIRTILLAAAIGTTGLAANAYQAGAMIPQTVFTLVSGGIFNAVLVPQIVRTLKERDAQERLNRLITLVIGILLAVTVVMAASTPLLARLYVGSSNHEMIALTTAFTLWCMPQVFFYGLYTVLGQILAAKDHFASYAWSSTGANVISCAGFTAFIMLFGKANEQPLDFWTSGKVALTAGTWTLGVAFQALILFVPLIRLGFKYRPSFGLTGFGLKAMGPVALGSLGVVAITQISDIVLTRIATLAPQRAHELTGASLYDVAGNATYQNAFTLYILPYSLIAVSVSTAVFPLISRSIAAQDFHAARQQLGNALCNVGLLVLFFATALVVYPEPIIRALLPSVSMNETVLIAYALIPLSCGIPAISAFLLIQRTFYAFEDGLHPFLAAVLQYGFTTALMIVGIGAAVHAVYAAQTIRRQPGRQAGCADIRQGVGSGRNRRRCGLAGENPCCRPLRCLHPRDRRPDELAVRIGNLHRTDSRAGRGVYRRALGTARHTTDRCRPLDNRSFQAKTRQHIR